MIDYLEATLDYAKLNKVKTHIAWVSANPKTSRTIEVRVFDHLFTVPEIPVDEPWEQFINPESKRVYDQAKVDTLALDFRSSSSAAAASVLDLKAESSGTGLCF